MRKRMHTDDYYYFVVLNKSTNRVAIYTTMTVMCDVIGINRITLYRKLKVNNMFINDSYTVWSDVEMFMCNKGRDL
jgi:hypothetical protein